MLLGQPAICGFVYQAVIVWHCALPLCDNTVLIQVMIFRHDERCSGHCG